jgi:hypothetical protein
VKTTKDELVTVNVDERQQVLEKGEHVLEKGEHVPDRRESIPTTTHEKEEEARVNTEIRNDAPGGNSTTLVNSMGHVTLSRPDGESHAHSLSTASIASQRLNDALRTNSL